MDANERQLHLNLENLVSASRQWLEASRGSKAYDLLKRVDHLYGVIHQSVDFSVNGSESAQVVHMAFLLCHRALLSASVAALSGNPEDSPALTRRALEAAKLVLAIKANPANFRLWTAPKQRIGRWKLRNAGQKPKEQLRLNYEGLKDDPLFENIQALIGALSDIAVHFTPEHISGYEWLHIANPDGLTVSFERSVEDVQQEALMLAAQHQLIHCVFDRYFDEAIRASGNVQDASQTALEILRECFADFGHEDQIERMSQSWFGVVPREHRWARRT